jgi:predicted aminopeptidase
VITRRKQVSANAESEYAADVALAAQFDDLLGQAREAEQVYRKAQAENKRDEELYPLARALDVALTSAMRSAYAAQRAEIGPRGYDDWIYRRKSKAKSAVHAWTDEAERLLTLRETHRLTGTPPAPRTDLPGGGSTHVPAVGI